MTVQVLRGILINQIFSSGTVMKRFDSDVTVKTLRPPNLKRSKHFLKLFISSFIYIAVTGRLLIQSLIASKLYTVSAVFAKFG